LAAAGSDAVTVNTVTAPPVTVLIADDEELTRTGLRVLLSAEPDLEVVGEAGNGAEVLPMVDRLRPDVVLMDVRMPVLDGIEATRRLRSGVDSPPKVVVITTFESDDHVYDALRAGADGFILKRAPAQQIAHAIRLVTTGESLLFPEAVRRLVAARPLPPAGALGGQNPLTARETEILRLMAAGLSNLDIATLLVISLETVKTHVSNVFTKLGAQNRTQAVILAYESGLVVPGSAGPAAR
jgi:DNA-binding NarL/FixJ family response regulator